MDRNDLTEQRAVFTLLGELSADVKHILSALDNNKRETARLREDVHKETLELKERLTKVEKFNVRVLTYASIALPVFIAAINWLVSVVFARI